MVELGTDLEELDDATLVTGVRQGDLDCFGVLYTRHFDCGARAARRAGTPADQVEDVVAEGFARTLRAIHGGNGPTTNFAGYLSITTTRVAWQHSKERSRCRPTDDTGFLDTQVVEIDLPPASPVLDALRDLPEAWRTLLWRLEVENESILELALDLGKSTGAISAMATRARHRLRSHPSLEDLHRRRACA
ncbi:sigma-70 family RNA polymerase sigma factor [Nocardioides marmoriginsengisoli]|uniref:Sigma-70 family RNA polymerase sigma factor n=1 Tax=Nocardioides marmoriginsengisoli TaxID=661483 RepID=A0A3N0CHQ2_9ACTN|nr:sigma-70 family RNA polymerase sigma factor [Nocardioides marmoriginsengisoli]RNL62546.1 sigma-70 family RNA polymerase sigma factor [Nocardioides marmoriginsengisoli]